MSADYYKTKESVEEYIAAAKGFDGRALIEKFKGFLPPASHILEIGSGPGTDWQILNNNFKTTGSDFSEEFLKRLSINFPDSEFLELDAVSLDTTRKFDGIYSNKVLHHLKDEELKTSIKKQASILNSGGVICHSFWKGEGSEIFKGLFVNYHFENGLKTLFDKHFEVLRMESYKEFDDDDSILLIGKKLPLI